MHMLLEELKTMTQEVMDNLLIMDEEQFEQFADKRQSVVQRMVSFRTSISERDKEQIATILSYDSEILKRMSVLQGEAGDWLEKRESIRGQKNAYQQVYTIESLFIDHRN